MTKKVFSIYMISVCAVCIISPGRFACAIILSLEILLLMLLGILFKKLIFIMKLEKVHSFAMMSFCVFFTMLFRQCVAALSAELALQLGFIIYLPAISAFSVVFSMDCNDFILKDELKKNMIIALIFCVYILVLTLLREIFGYGTITIPALGTVFEKVLFMSERISIFTFFATIPGAFVLTAMIISVYIFFDKKYNFLERAGVIK